MSLATRIGRLENAAGRKLVRLPDMIVRFIEPIQDEDGLMRPGPCTGAVCMAFGKPPQWFDAEGVPVAGPA